MEVEVESDEYGYGSNYLNEANSLSPQQRLRVAALRSACEACTTSKVKCNGMNPCNLCQKRGIECCYMPQLKRGPRSGRSLTKTLTPSSVKSNGIGRSNRPRSNSKLSSSHRRKSFSAKLERTQSYNSVAELLIDTSRNVSELNRSNFRRTPSKLNRSKFRSLSRSRRSNSKSRNNDDSDGDIYPPALSDFSSYRYHYNDDLNNLNLSVHTDEICLDSPISRNLDREFQLESPIYNRGNENSEDFVEIANMFSMKPTLNGSETKSGSRVSQSYTTCSNSNSTPRNNLLSVETGVSGHSESFKTALNDHLFEERDFEYFASPSLASVSSSHYSKTDYFGNFGKQTNDLTDTCFSPDNNSPIMRKFRTSFSSFGEDDEGFKKPKKPS